MTISAPSQAQKPYPGGHEIYNFGSGLPGLHTIVTMDSVFIRCSEVKTIFGPAPRTPWSNSHETNNQCSPYTQDASYQIKGIGHIGFKKKLNMFNWKHTMQDAQQRTKEKSIAIS